STGSLPSTPGRGRSPAEYKVPLDREVRDKQERLDRYLSGDHADRQNPGQERDQYIRETDIGDRQQEIARKNDLVLLPGEKDRPANGGVVEYQRDQPGSE